MTKTKNLTIGVVTIATAVLTGACFAESETFATPTSLLNSRRSVFLSGGLEQVSSPDERTAHLMLMTNVVCSVIRANHLSSEDVKAGTLMLDWLLRSHAVTSDKDAVLYLLNSLSTVQPVATNEYARDIRIAREADSDILKARRRCPGSLSVVSQYQGPNTRDIEKKWRPIFDHNKNCAEFRARLVEAFALALPNVRKSLKENDVEDVFNAVERMGGFTADEKRLIFVERCQVDHDRTTVVP